VNPGTDRDTSPKVPLTLQQRCLDIFRDALNPSVDDAGTLQEVKGHLYNRDFSAAFGKSEYLRVYASRWSPSRALAYLDVLTDVRSSHATNLDLCGDAAFSIMCLGGGAGGELVALAGWFNSLKMRVSGSPPPRLDVTLLDIADWTSVVDDLHEGITKPPQISKYASEATKNANEALVNQVEVSISFQQKDVLSTEDALVKSFSDQVSGANLITFMFTLNELYSASMTKTQNLLSRTMAAANPGTILLVVDSPGSYSTISLNGTEKKYPMQWLLDYTMLGSPKKPESQLKNAKWEKLMEDSSRWFRLPTGLNYPIELENMRYQIHLYRRLDDEK
jgi:25S rRNA (uracil2843-N3)-methyltransferase